MPGERSPGGRWSTGQVAAILAIAIVFTGLVVALIMALARPATLVQTVPATPQIVVVTATATSGTPTAVPTPARAPSGATLVSSNATPTATPVNMLGKAPNVPPGARIELGTTVTSTIDSAAQRRDYYSFDARRGEMVRLTLSCTQSCVLHLFSLSGGRILLDGIRAGTEVGQAAPARAIFDMAGPNATRQFLVLDADSSYAVSIEASTDAERYELRVEKVIPIVN